MVTMSKASLVSSPADRLPDWLAGDALSAELGAILQHRRLTAVYQPIVELADGRIFAHEGLIRGPATSVLAQPTDLFAAAETGGRLLELDRLCLDVMLAGVAACGRTGKWFVNVCPDSILAGRGRPEACLRALAARGMRPEDIVIELTESRPSGHYDHLRSQLRRYRDMGFGLALDDLGEGFSSLRLWAELQPDFVKLDKFFVRGIHQDPVRQRFAAEVADIAAATGARVIAEGIETFDELEPLYRYGIGLGQGYLFGRPEAVPLGAIERETRDRMTTYAPMTASPARATAGELLIEVPTLPPAALNEQAYQLFNADSDCFAIPVVDGGQPVGLLRRHHVLETFARPFSRELYSKKSCMQMMDADPLVVDCRMSLEALSARVVAADRRYLVDGFIITDEGRYLGMGTGFDLMRRMTEMQISAARYANPLTGLPGNVPINETIDQLLADNAHFVIAYCDLDHFKPFNDLYGYHKGDELIQLAGSTLVEAADGRCDFVGHIGGDDFIMLMRSVDWQPRLERVLVAFDDGARAFFRPGHREAGGYVLPGRTGDAAFFPLTCMSIGAVKVEPGQYASHHELSAAAADAKHIAKKTPGRSLFVERRVPA